MVENDAVNVTAYVRIYKDPTGVLWHNFLKSVLVCLSGRKAAKISKLQFQKGDRHGGSQKPGGNLLFELAPPITLLYKCIPKGMSCFLNIELEILSTLL